jgi:flagellar basal body-associated protein FliL
MLNDDNSKKKKKSLKIYIYIYIWLLRVADMEIRQFWTKKWTDVPFSYFSITQVPPIKKKLIGQKIKVLNCRGQKVI